MSSMRFHARLDMSHGPQNPFKDAKVVAYGLTNIHNAMVNCLFVDNRSCTDQGFRVPIGKNSDVSNLASFETMYWVFLYLSIGQDGRY
jgi:hypothetical protein